MIHENNLREMMDVCVNDGEIPTKRLNDLGFISGDLTKLVNEKNVLERVRHGYYKVNTSELFKYAKSMIESNDLEKAFDILYRCYLDDKNNIEYVYNLFMVSILTEKYDVSIQCLRQLLNDTSNIYAESEINYYFYLLGLSINLPEELIGMFKYMKFENIQVLTGDKNADIPKNRLRSKIIDGNFQNLEITEEKESLEFKVQSKLLDIINKKQFLERDYVYDLVRKKKLHEVLKYFKEDLSYRNLSKTEERFAKIINSYFVMERTKKMPVVKDFNCSNVWEAIDNNNFRSAFRIQKEHCDENGIIPNKNILYLLLLEVNEMIDAVKSLNDGKPFVKKVVQEFGEDISKKIIPDENPSSKEKSDITLDLILETLMNKDIDNACDYVQSYLSDAQEYSYIVNHLIKISVYEEDISFSKPMMAISMMKSNSFEFVVSEYVLSFYESLAKKKFEVASVYLDILESAISKHHTKLSIKAMREVLNNAINESKDKLKRPNYDFVSNNKEVSYSFDDLNTGCSMEEFVSKGILLFDSNEFNIKNSLPILESLSFMDTFVIECGEKKKIVMRYKDNKNVNSQEFISRLISDGEINYVLGNYMNALSIYKNVLLKSFNPNSSLYYRIGAIYLKLGNKDYAKDYFLVASALSKIENIDNMDINILNTIMAGDVVSEVKTEVLEEPKLELQSSSTKEVVKDEKLAQIQVAKKREEEVFHYYGFNIDKVVDLVVNVKMSLSDACNTLGLWEEEYFKAALYIAREYYYLGDIKKGNTFLNLVETKRNRSKTIDEFFKQVKINKKFYHNSELDGPRLLLK